MRRNNIPTEENSSQDSFLDVIANVVGVLIILVMLVGIRATHHYLQSDTHAPPDSETSTSQHNATAESPSDSKKQLDLDKQYEQLKLAKQQARESEAELTQLANRLKHVHQETLRQNQRRDELALHRAILKEDLERRRKQLDSARQNEFDVQRQLLDTQIQLDQLTREQLALMSAPKTVQKIECVPTPLAQTVEGSSIHLRLKDGLVSIVPFEELLAQIEYRADDIRRRLQERDEVSEVFGPVGGYRLRFTVAKRAASEIVTGPLAGQRHAIAYEQFAEILPDRPKIGQNVEQALMPGAELYNHLLEMKRQRPSVVVWLYNDSFEPFRPLKRKLWEMGFSLATRPLPPNAHIAASPHGTRAAAQ